MFSYFDVDPTSLPTVVYYIPQHNRYASLIGKFDTEVIGDHEERFKQGKLSTQEARVPRKALTFEDVDCPAQQLEAASTDDDDFNEILAEILAEEQARKAELEAELEADKPTKKKGKKKSKKKGKKKSKDVMDEL